MRPAGAGVDDLRRGPGRAWTARHPRWRRRALAAAGVDGLGVNCGVGPVACLEALEQMGAGRGVDAAADHAQRRPAVPRRGAVRVCRRARLLRGVGAPVPGRRRAPHRWLLRHDPGARRGHAPGTRPRDRTGAAGTADGDRGRSRDPAGCRRRAPDRDHGTRRRAARDPARHPPPTGLAAQARPRVASSSAWRSTRPVRCASSGPSRRRGCWRRPASTSSTSATAPWPGCA